MARGSFERVAAHRAYRSVLKPDPPRVELPRGVRVFPVPDDEKARTYFKDAVKAMLGMFFLPILPIVFVLNSRMMSESFEVLFNRAATVMIDWTITIPRIGDVTLSITDFLLFGISLALAQLLISAAAGEDFKHRSPLRWFVLVLGVLPFCAAVIVTAAVRGVLLVVEGEDHLSPMVNGAMSALWAHVLAASEVIAALWAVHRFLVPVLQGTCWALVTPFRAVRHWRLRRALERAQRAVVVDSPLAPRHPRWFDHLGAGLHAGLFHPLEEVDRRAAVMLRLR
jgi:hypothetical protein